jgi:hypothetical protein
MFEKSIVGTVPLRGFDRDISSTPTLAVSILRSMTKSSVSGMAISDGTPGKTISPFSYPTKPFFGSAAASLSSDMDVSPGRWRLALRRIEAMFGTEGMGGSGGRPGTREEGVGRDLAGDEAD